MQKNLICLYFRTIDGFLQAIAMRLMQIIRAGHGVRGMVNIIIESLRQSPAALFSSSHTFTMASVSSLQYARRFFLAFSCSSGGMY